MITRFHKIHTDWRSDWLTDWLQSCTLLLWICGWRCFSKSPAGHEEGVMDFLRRCPRSTAFLVFKTLGADGCWNTSRQSPPQRPCTSFHLLSLSSQQIAEPSEKIWSSLQRFTGSLLCIKWTGVGTTAFLLVTMYCTQDFIRDAALQAHVLWSTALDSPTSMWPVLVLAVPS